MDYFVNKTLNLKKNIGTLDNLNRLMYKYLQYQGGRGRSLCKRYSEIFHFKSEI